MKIFRSRAWGWFFTHSKTPDEFSFSSWLNKRERERENKTENTPADPRSHPETPQTTTTPPSQQNSICLRCGEDSTQRAICHTRGDGRFRFAFNQRARVHSLPPKYPHSKGQITRYWRLIQHQVKLKGSFGFWVCFSSPLFFWQQHIQGTQTIQCTSSVDLHLENDQKGFLFGFFLGGREDVAPRNSYFSAPLLGS